ncbi:transcription factor 3b isoform X1 [Syngnathoides biaculeatus]|uniref:transcription factor 3b isoform X1 n=2 Tax=Syngnathoides biaculeatus TaxID=300417 RepID=UPI002ADDF551|nr:transcription factor 3b isoform X1 [Syngnathoides biaculeatus]XP_061681012.1 transcription factor 3b isoform X1 [Syngnathoides biaculeatus]XP_061681013.1 transcription factor 3b isoform X1 [Syngnathoides biaculeatus]XP_061681014.1 transcription factor 3b isoform X1 [Syngnathoides biaculeatus]XP_061681015.1 transcription factor 3b isoform X1 [Syngnathoides biaculeatus]
MTEQQQRMAAVGTDKELSDLLDFSAMFAPPVANGKNRTMTLASSQFSGSALDERSSSGSWGSAEQNSPSFSQGRGYGEGSHYSEHEGLASPFISSGIAGKNERPSYSPFANQPGFLPSEIAMPSPDAMSPSGLKSGSQFYQSYQNNPRRRPPDGGLDSQPKKIRKPPGLPSSVYASTSGDEYARDNGGYPGGKPGTVYPGSFYMQEDPWSSTGYSAMLSNSTHIGPPGSFSSLNPQDRMNYPLHGSEVNGFHAAPTTYNHTPAINGEAIMAGNRATTVQVASSGDEIGKALASIYPSDHNSNNFSSAPSTPGSPQAITGGQSQWQRPTTPSFEAQPHTLQSKMEDRLEEAIHVLRNHAVGQGPGLDGAHPDMHSLLSAAVHNGGLGSLSPAFPNASLALSNRHPVMGGKHEEATGLPPSSTLLHGHHASGSTPSVGQPESFTSLPGGMTRSTHSSSSSDIKREDKEEDENSSNADKSDDEKKDSKAARSRTRKEALTLQMLSSLSDPKDDAFTVRSPSSQDNEDDEDLPPEVKMERERERRVANNARERLRVRDINEAFKELGRMCQLHLSHDKPQTKLLILHQAVNVILNLEQQVRERNLNPKAACLKRREEEKVSGVVGEAPMQLSGGHPSIGGDGHNPVGHM